MTFLIHHHLEHYSALSPENNAIHCLDENLSYGELNLKANQLAHRLIENDVKPGTRVGIYMDKCPEMAIAVYGILKAGAVYVPLDPSAPNDRLINIISDCGINIVLTQKNKQKRIQQLNTIYPEPLLFIGASENTDDACYQAWSWVYSCPNLTPPSVDIIENDLAYIIYTSGSTGKPKGIMHTHHSCLSFARWASKEYGLHTSDKVGNHSPLHFDISIFDWFATLVAGASIVLIPSEYTKIPASYSALLEKSQITILFTVPFALIQLSLNGAVESRDLRQLRWIIFGGEPFPIKHLHRLTQQLPHVRFDNMYGPAEVNGCTHYTLKKLKETDSSIPIGRINQIAQALVVDENDRQVEIGQVGELLVRTPTMMQGYWARPDLNQHAFYRVTDQTKYDGQFTHVYYRTGDLVKLDELQQLWFIGRKDRQVKVRGYRVELDEIEATLVAHADVVEASAFSVIKEDQLSIHAAYTLKENVLTETKHILKFLKARLPIYALPAQLKSVQAFPRTTSGKIDRTALSKEAINDISFK